jgi:hypothetical protein
MQYISVQKAVMRKRIGIDICIDRLTYSIHQW